MIYSVHNAQRREASTGKVYFTATLTDINGQSYDNVSTFDTFQDGKSVEGSIVQNGKYLNFKATSAVASGGKTGQIEKAMDKKNERIEYFQDSKEKSIQHVASIRDATLLTVAMLESKIWATVTEDFIKNKLRENVVFYKTLYENPDHITPSSDAPF